MVQFRESLQIRSIRSNSRLPGLMLNLVQNCKILCEVFALKKKIYENFFCNDKRYSERSFLMP